MEAYLIRLTAAAILGAVVKRLAPKGGAGRAARLGAGLLVLITAFGPVAEVDPLAAAEHLAQAAYADPLTTEELSRAGNTLLSGLISQQAEAYILDKAREAGLELQATVENRDLEGYPVPWRVTLTGPISESKQAALAAVIAQDLGIPEERQEWLDM